MKIGVLFFVAAIISAGFSCRAVGQVHSILTYHADSRRTGNFIIPTLTWGKARSLRRDRSFNARVSGHLYAQPLYWHPTSSKKAMLLVATEDNVVQAFDAKTGKELWRRSVGSPVPRSYLPCGNIDPLGITGTPAIDQSSAAIYFDAAVHDTTGVHHRIFGLSLRDGTILRGWPVDVADVVRRSGDLFNPRVQNQRGAVTIFDGTLYVPFGGHFGDCGDYHGWVIGLPLHDPNKRIVTWRTRARGGGIWAPGGISAVGQQLYFATGNTFGATKWSDGEAVWRVGPDLHRVETKQAFFAPEDWRTLDQYDLDLGGTNPIPLDLRTGTGTQPLLLALGKDRKAYLLNRNDLGGIGGQLVSAIVSKIPIRTSPAEYPGADGIFVAFQGPGLHCPARHQADGLTVLKIGNGSPPTMHTAWCGAVRGAGSPIVTTTDGHSNPIVWILGAEGDNRLHGYRGNTGEPIFTSDELHGLRHFQTLIATEHRLYVGADDRIFAFRF